MSRTDQPGGALYWLFEPCLDLILAGNFVNGECMHELMMQVSALPPHAVAVQPEHESILIASSSPGATAGSSAGPDSSALRSGMAVLCSTTLML